MEKASFENAALLALACVILLLLFGGVASHSDQGTLASAAVTLESFVLKLVSDPNALIGLLSALAALWTARTARTASRFSQEAAKAAQMAIQSLERPLLVMDVVESNFEQALNQSIPAEARPRPFVTGKIKNLGRSVGLVRLCIFQIFITKVYKKIEHTNPGWKHILVPHIVPHEAFLAPGDTTSNLKTSTIWDQFDDFLLEDLHKDRKSLYVGVKIEYDDNHGTIRRSLQQILYDTEEKTFTMLQFEDELAH